MKLTIFYGFFFLKARYKPYYSNKVGPVGDLEGQILSSIHLLNVVFLEHLLALDWLTMQQSLEVFWSPNALCDAAAIYK